jgi:WhiB family redox-sensing transcriptional regulator
VAVPILPWPVGHALRADWVGDAACREAGVDPELFFPVSESGPGARQAAAAKAICARCPVLAQCRDWAVLAGEPAGIWGGTTPEERRLLRQARLGGPSEAGEPTGCAGRAGTSRMRRGGDGQPGPVRRLAARAVR